MSEDLPSTGTSCCSNSLVNREKNVRKSKSLHYVIEVSIKAELQIKMQGIQVLH